MANDYILDMQDEINAHMDDDYDYYYPTEESEIKHNAIVEHNAKLANDEPMVYPVSMEDGIITDGAGHDTAVLKDGIITME